MIAHSKTGLCRICWTTFFSSLSNHFTRLPQWKTIVLGSVFVLLETPLMHPPEACTYELHVQMTV